MEVESFENEEVAKMLNDWFVSIKVVIVLYNDYKKMFIWGMIFLPVTPFLSTT